MKVSNSFRITTTLLLGVVMAAGWGAYSMRNSQDEEVSPEVVSAPSVSDMFSGFNGSSGLRLTPIGISDAKEEWGVSYEADENSPQLLALLLSQVQEVLYANEYQLDSAKEFEVGMFQDVQAFSPDFAATNVYRNADTGCRLLVNEMDYQQQRFSLVCSRGIVSEYDTPSTKTNSAPRIIID